MAPTLTTAEAKRLWMQAVRQQMRLSVTDFAQEMGWDRSDTSAMLNGTGGRGIPDERIDEVVTKYKLPTPMATSLTGPVSASGITNAQAEKLLDQGDATARLLRLLLEKVDPLAKPG